jgi:hypothetical protein
MLGPEGGWRVSRQTVAEASRLLPVRAGRDARTRDWSETLQLLFHPSWRAAVQEKGMEIHPSCFPGFLINFFVRKPDKHGQEIGTGLARANRHAVLAVHDRYTKVLKKRIA